MLTKGIVQRITKYADTTAPYDIGTTALDIAVPGRQSDVTYSVVENDVLLMALSHKGSGWATVPAGWTLIGQDISGAIRGEWYWKRAGTSEVGPYAITGLADTAVGVVWAYTNCKQTGSPIGASSVRVNAAGATGTDGVTTSSPYSLVISSAALADNVSCSAWTAAGASRNLIEVRDVSTSLGSDCALGIAHLLQREAGATGATGWTSTAVANVGICFELLPDTTEAERTGTAIEGIPTNLSAASAYVVGANPLTVIQDVSGATFPQEVWFKYTPDATETAFGLHVWSNVLAGTFNPRTAVYYGTPSSMTLVLEASWNEVHAPACAPLCVPVIAGETYYIRVQNSVNLYGTPDQDDATIVLDFVRAPIESIADGDIFIPAGSYETPGFGGTILDPDDGHVKRIINAWDSPTLGDRLPSGIMLVRGDDPTKLALYDASLVKLTDVSGVVVFNDFDYAQPQIRSDRNHMFYVGQQPSVDPEVLPAVIKTVSDEGVVGPTTWTLPIATSEMLTTMAPSLDGTILYYSSEQSGILYRHDLVNDVALPDFAAPPSGFKTTRDLLVLNDGSLLVAYHDPFPYPARNYVYHYAADGSVLHVYDFTVYYPSRLGYGRTEDTFVMVTYWQGEDGSSGVSNEKKVWEIRISDGVKVREFSVDVNDIGIGTMTQVRAPLPRFGPPAACPIFVLDAIIVPSSSPSASPEPPEVRLIRRMRQSPHLSDEQVTLFFAQFQIDFEAGAPREGID